MSCVPPGNSASIAPLMICNTNDPIHAAVARGDSKQVLQARIEGMRADVLDSERRSPIDVLESMRDLDKRSLSRMRIALLQSLNPTAPLGYIKPEALHGSPWGLEILTSGSLKGGVNDAKGGSQSLNGRVFFSDRTPESATDATTRKNLRTKARTYSRGLGIVPSSASSRAQQHRLTQILTHSTDRGSPLSLTYKPVTLAIKDPQAINAEGSAWLQNFLHDAYIVSGAASKLLTAPPEQSVNAVKLPRSITFKFENAPDCVLEGKALEVLYTQWACKLREALEQGKAPYLSLINKGTVIPVVFGFEKLRNLSSHPIHDHSGNATKLYSYQNQNHPLSGGANGGKLKEIEVRSLADLATLLLGCEVKSTQLPEEVLVRIKGKREDKAEYLTPAQLSQFRQRVLAQAALHAPQGSSLALASMSHLQQINAIVRSGNLQNHWV
ncbi:ankyrin repeat domain-containing protein [Pseudomonas sp. S5D5]|uniref:ankyrin repeat domain-containing protein n=1 Tax=Pseudomonas sp. S5D5 TaxID=2083056 RepID=UPI002115AC48|nr:ankyrin repeat domain-containing protein [Pseudomonas sp. S5D5]